MEIVAIIAAAVLLVAGVVALWRLTPAQSPPEPTSEQEETKGSYFDPPVSPF
jgi:hypothetical protein